MRVGSKDREQTDAQALRQSGGPLDGALSEPLRDLLPHGIDLVPDGLIPSTVILDSALRAALGSPRVQLRRMEQLDAASVCERPIIFSRVCAAHLSWLPRCLVDAGARYGYFLDDNLWAYSADNEVAHYYARPHIRESLNEFIQHAAAVFVPSDLLAYEVRSRFSSVPVFSVPAPFDFSNAPEQSPPLSEQRRALRVGYAGSERGVAFDAVSEAILRTLHERPEDIAFEFIGFMPDQLADCPGVTHYPAVADYKQFLAFKRSRHWDVGLAPLSDNAFCRAKTNNKFREYGALSIAGIYSAVEPYRGCVSDGVNGMLVGNTPDDWYEALLRMLDDREACGRMGSAARAYVWEHHRLERVASDWTAALTSARLTPVTDRMRLHRKWWRYSAPAKVRARLEIYNSLRQKKGIFSLFSHLSRRAMEVMYRRAP